MKTLLAALAFVFQVVTASAQENGHLQRPANRLAKIEVNDIDMKSLIFAKSFCVAMRRNHEPERTSRLLKFIDPAYLKKHQIDSNHPVPETFPLYNIYDIKIASDPTTILCIVDTKNGPRQALLLRTKNIDRKLYLNPIKAPSKTKHTFEPWILKMNAAPVPSRNTKIIAKEKRSIAGILKHFPQDVKSVEAWEGSEFKIGDSTIFPTEKVTREDLLKLVGLDVSISGNWNPGEHRPLTNEEKLHSHPLLAQGEIDIVGSGLEATSLRKID